MAERIRSLIAETEGWLAHHIERRDRVGMSRHDRSGEGIEAAACAIRLKALKQCLAIVEGEQND